MSPLEQFDRLFTQAAIRLSRTVSRRKFMSLAGKGVATFIFTTGLAKLLLDTLVTPAKAQSPVPKCTSNNNCAVSGTDCSGYAIPKKKDCDCSKCLGPDGCPKDSHEEPPWWTGCCPCAEVPGKGRRVRYVDCCGPLGPDCDPQCCGVLSQLPTENKPCFPYVDIWCASKVYRCTHVLATNECCDVATGAPCGTWS